MRSSSRVISEEKGSFHLYRNSDFYRYPIIAYVRAQNGAFLKASTFRRISRCEVYGVNPDLVKRNCKPGA